MFVLPENLKETNPNSSANLPERRKLPHGERAYGQEGLQRPYRRRKP